MHTNGQWRKLAGLMSSVDLEFTLALYSDPIILPQFNPCATCQGLSKLNEIYKILFSF